ncbi:MAG: DUF4886 domain-containing protein [Ruminococcaceae bacterium]|nr:DUF4886 domain-containing protein [Oscillospiraceae bacterium]
MRILTIGNSFSEDATRYLYDIAKAAGESFEIVNIAIGGCSLETHYNNMLERNKSYLYFHNGVFTGDCAELTETVESGVLDVITLQQVSHLSFNKATYYPYISELVKYIREKQPKARLMLHETWAYEDGSERLCVMAGYKTSDEMLSDIKKTYSEVAAAEGFDGVILSGDMFGALLKSGIAKIHRDTFHASLGLGRYALGLLWFKMLTGRNVSDNSFCELDEPISASDIEIIKGYIDQI